MSEEKVRIEHDSMGEIAVPADKYWGAQTERSRRNFPVGAGHETMPEEILRAFAVLKKAAAQANRAVQPQRMTEEKCAAMEEAARLRCDQMLKEAEATVQQAQKDSDECWRDVKGKLEDYLRQQTALQGLLSRTPGEETE